MKFKKVHIQSVLNYDEFSLDFKKSNNGLYLIYGPNETGKSTLLQVLIDLLFGGKADPNMYESASRIHAIVEDKGKEYKIHRRKRYSNIEVDRNKDGLSEEDIARLLGGYTKEQYELLFGFDHERLRAGGESLLASEGQAGISLFETGGGLQNLQRLLSELDERSKELLEPGFRANSKRKINVAVRSFNDAMHDLRNAGLKGDDYEKLRSDVLDKEELVKKLNEKKKQYDQEKNKYERIKRIRNKVFELENLRASLADFGDFTPLPDEYDDWIPKKVAELDQEKTALQSLLAEKQARENEMAEIEIDHEILALGEEIDRLNEELGQYKTRKYEEVPQEKEQLEQLKISAREIFHRLAPDLSVNQMESLRIPFVDEEKIVKLARKRNDLRKECQYIEEQLDSKQKERQMKVEELKEIGEIKDVSALKQIVDELRKTGDLEKAITNKKAEITLMEQDIDRRLKRQAIWTGNASGLMETAVPLEETIDRYHEDWQKYTNKCEELQRHLTNVEQELRRIEQELEQIEHSGEIPVEEELIAAREHRDVGWHLIKKVWLEGERNEAVINEYARKKPLHLAYEQAVKRADDIADIMRKESELSAKRSHLLLRQKQRQEDVVHLKEKLAIEKEAFARFQEEWQKEWDPCGIDAKSPAEMKAWYRNFYMPLIADLHKLQTEQNEYEILLQKKQQYHDRLERELATIGIPLDGPKDLNVIVDFAENVIAKSEKDRDLALFTEKAIHEIERQLKEQETKLEQFDTLINETEQELDMMRMKYPHLPGESEMIEVYIEQIRDLFQQVDAIKQKRTELANKEKAIGEFEERTRNIAKHLNEQLDAYVSFEQYVRELRERYRVASESLHARNRIQKQIEHLEDEIVTKNRELERLQNEVNRYLTTYHCDREEELLHFVQRSREYKDIQRQIVETEQDLLDAAGVYMSIEELINEVKTAPEEAVINHELENLEKKIQEIEYELSEEHRLLGELYQQLKQLDGSDTRAADRAQDAEVHMAEIDRYWNEFLRVEIARKLLERAIERFREENEGAMIEKAGAFFQKLTLGTYQGLTIEYDGVDPYIEVFQHSGHKLRVPLLSDGARDQLYLSLRLAFIDQQLDNGQPLPIIMDDILVNFDDERSLATLKVLDELAEKTQILYFTHHRSIARMQTNLKNAEMINLEQLKRETVTS